MGFSGLFELKSSKDLFRKLEHDLRRLEAEPLDTYAAFDFFVTAEHMLDWVHPNDKTGQKKEREAHPLLEVCSHLANGSKHFEATDRRHKSVDNTQKHEGAFSSGFDVQSFDVQSFDISRLEVKLKGAAEKALGPVVEVTDLARQVLQYWRNRIGL